MVESKVGRMSAGFYALFADDQRLAYLWQRRLFTDLPNVPHTLRLEFYELHNIPLWNEMFAWLSIWPERVACFKEYVYDGDITLRRIAKSPLGKVRSAVYDGEQIAIADPHPHTELTPLLGWDFPGSLVWSNLHPRIEPEDRAAGVE